MQILEFYHKDQKSLESIQRFEINTSLFILFRARHIIFINTWFWFYSTVSWFW